jgi:hypothetical protein
VLSRGARGDLGVAPEPGSLTAIPSAGAARRYALGSPFNALSQTDDGRYAMAYFRPQTASGRLLYNPNEVAVVDLDAPPSTTNPTPRTVRSFGGVPNSVVFSPGIEIGGVSRRFAVVLSDAYVTLLDLDHPARPEVTVRLTLPEDPRAIRPEQVLFDAAEATIYLRAAASNDVYVLKLNAVSATDAAQNDYRPTINQLAAGRSPADLALIGEAGMRRLLVVSPGSRDARVIDARANTVTTVPLDAAANRILLFTGASPGNPAARAQALLYAVDGVTQAVSFLELTDIDARRAQNVETLNLGRGVQSALPLLDRGVVMLGHPDQRGPRAALPARPRAAHRGAHLRRGLPQRRAVRQRPALALDRPPRQQPPGLHRPADLSPRGDPARCQHRARGAAAGRRRRAQPRGGRARGRRRMALPHRRNDPRRESVRSLRGYLLSDLLTPEATP